MDQRTSSRTTYPVKRKSPDTPFEISAQHKKYLLDTSTLLKNNKYYGINTDEQPNSGNINNQEQNKKNKIPPIYLHDVNNYQAIVGDIKSLTIEDFTTQYKVETICILPKQTKIW
ncbi:hypothetical protein CBL_04854 [Carabus blaptoides fortunei]